MNTVIDIWKFSLARLLSLYEERRGALIWFIPKLFLFFVLINIGCYWWAMFTAFPESCYGEAGAHYFLVQFPVGILGAIFDTFSFFVTIYIIRRALKAKTAVEYVSHLSIDLAIAILATFWVLFVFSFSGWIISHIEAQPELLEVRTKAYNQLLINAIAQPGRNLRNIYFGIIMGISASFPTVTHVFLFLRSLIIKKNEDQRTDFGYSESTIDRL